MLPCRRVTTSAFGARFLKLAEGNARSLKGTSATKRLVLDGCLIESKRSGRNLSATVIDPQHALMMMIHENVDASGKINSLDYIIRISDRQAFDPMNGAGLYLGERYIPSDFKGTYLGARPNGLKATSRMQHSKPGDRKVFMCDLMLDMSGVHFIRMLESGAGDSTRRGVVMNASIIRNVAPGYSIDFDMSGKAFSGFLISGDGDTRILVINITKKLAEDPVITREALLMVVIERDKYGTSLSAAVLDETALPMYLRPGSVLYPQGDGYISRPAKTKFKALDVERQPNGKVLVAFKYEMEVGDADMQKIGVECHGTASWGYGTADVNVHTVEVDADSGHPFVESFDVDDGVVVYGDTVSLVGGKAMRAVRVLSRDSPSSGVAPFSLELVDGTQNITPTFAAPFYGTPERPMGRDERNFAIPLGGISAKVSGTTSAVIRGAPITSAGQARSSGLGLMFTDGTRTLYEQVTGMPTSERHLFLHVSCPQQEVRKGSKLVSPSTILISGVIDGQTVVGVRKAPIWPEDKSIMSGAAEWEFTYTELPDNRAAYYIGNALTTRKLGSLFYD